MKIDASKTPLANIFALVNAANSGGGITFDTSIMTVQGSPSAQADSGDGRNTVMTFAAVANSGYTGSVNITYKRRPLNDSVLNPSFSTNVDDGVTKATIIASVAAQLGLVQSELDLTGDITRPSGSDTSQVNLVLGSGSTGYLYIPGSSQIITLNWAHHDVPLTTAVANTNMDGFDAAS